MHAIVSFLMNFRVKIFGGVPDGRPAGGRPAATPGGMHGRLARTRPFRGLSIR
jgi:hypothetical protein